MTPLYRILIGCLFLSVSIHAARADAPSGHWEGTIDIPGNPIAIVVDLDSADDGRWVGAIDIPVQAMTDFPLSDIEIEGASVSFAMSGIPGDPVFRGVLTDEGSLLAGKFTQAGNSLAFRLDRTGNAELAALEPAPAVSAELATALVGRWEGTLEVPGQPLRVALVLVADAESLSATFDSPDQGQVGLPVSRLTVDRQKLRAELAFAGAAYDGTFNETLTEVSGKWRQGGGSLSLRLQKAGSSPDRAFPDADPESVGIPAKALKLLAERIQAFADNEEIVGGEFVVIKNRRTVLRHAVGWKDREAQQLLEVDAVYCVRSMTKPLVGTAIQMLIDEGRLQLDTPVYEILPYFAGPETGKITVEHLLTHTGGLPFTTIRKPLTDYADLDEVAAEAAKTTLEFEPGERFEYSDAGSDTLGAIVAKITGAPVEQFIGKRILQPLGMENTFALLGDRAEVIARVPSAYSGGTGSWSKHWKPADPPIFPVFLSSQSLYATTTDYARFLALWMDGGRVGDRQLLSPEAVERALAPGRKMSDYPQNFGDASVYYGQQWMVYAKPDDVGTPRRIVFGHGGSDGTHAWAWPEQDLMVLFFTQSRGTLAGLGLEGALQTLLVDQALDDPSLAIRTADAAELEQVAGLYWDEDVAEAYYVVAAQGNRLTLERPGKMHLVFRAGDKPGRFVHEANAQVSIEFVRSEGGDVTAMRTSFGGRGETDPRHRPQAGLPSVEEVVARVRRAHRLDRLAEVGPIRMAGTLNIESRQTEASLVTLFDATRGRTEIHAGPVEQLIVMNDDRAWTLTTGSPVEVLEGERLEQALLDRLSVRFGDWTQHYESVEVLKRVQLNEKPVLMVRVVPRESTGATMFVEEQSGLVVRADALAQLPGLGIVGVQTDYGDFRDVRGMRLPFRSVATFASPLIGRVVTTFAEAESGIAASADAFSALGVTDQ